MMKSKCIYRVQYQQLVINANRSIIYLHKCRKIRLILLRGLCKLLEYLQNQALNPLSEQVLESLIQYKIWLTRCFEWLHSSHNALPKYEKTTSVKILERYSFHVQNVLRQYEKDQRLIPIIGQNLKARPALKRLLTENIRFIKLTIQILQLFMRTENNVYCDSKVNNNLNSQRVENLNCLDEINSQSKQFKKEAEDEENKSCNATQQEDDIFKHLLEIQRLSGGMNGDRFSLRNQKFRKLSQDSDKSEQSFSIISLADDLTKNLSYEIPMQKVAEYIIDCIFKSKSAQWQKIQLAIIPKCKPDNGNSLTNFEYWHLEDVWENLLKKHNLILNKPQNIHMVKEDLTRFYIRQMQFLLRNSMESRIRLQKRCDRYSSTLDDNFKKYYDQLYDMHLDFYSSRMDKLGRTHENINIIRKISHLILGDDVRSSQSDLAALNEYMTDPHHYNILMLINHKDQHNRVNFLDIIERNYEKILNQLARKRRQSNMLITPTRNYKTDFSSWEPRERYSSVQWARSSLIIDDEFFKTERAKWAKYFEELQETPIDHYLKTKRMQRKEADRMEAISERNGRCTQREHTRCRQMKRNLSRLYTAPRLTHRMRQAINQISVQAYSINRPIINREAKIKPKPIETTTSKEQMKEEPLIAKLLLESGSWTSCCSKCRNFQYELAVDSALDRFFRTHDQILALGKQNCDNEGHSNEPIYRVSNDKFNRELTLFKN